MKKQSGVLVFSPTDLIRYFASPFASWMDRYHLENPTSVTPDEETEDQRLIAQTGDEHEQAALREFSNSTPGLVTIPKDSFKAARAATLKALSAKAPVIFQAALADGSFAGYADFLILDPQGRYQVWDTKLARSPKPYYAIQLCCYAEMLAAELGGQISDKFGIILGSNDQVEFPIEDFTHYYRGLRSRFLAMQEAFLGRLEDCPEPLSRADHGRWTSRADQYFAETDSLVQVANISVSQIKKLKGAGIATVKSLAGASGNTVRKLSADSLVKLAAQARLQCRTTEARRQDPDAAPCFEALPHVGANGEPLGLATLPAENQADVFFDMEGYPLIAGGLEYLFGACYWNEAAGGMEFRDWWAHDRDEEKVALEGFVDWVFTRWRNHPGMHIYHYASYEVSAVRRLSTRHDTRQDAVDDLLRNGVFVDLYKIVRGGLRIGESSYSIKKVEALYRPKRDTEVATAAASIVQYARWMESGQDRGWKSSTILKAIRDYNEDDCQSTAELAKWLRNEASQRGISFTNPIAPVAPYVPQPLPPEIIARQATAAALRQRADPVSLVLADLIEFHRREQKPIWWRMYDRTVASSEELIDDPACIEGIRAVGTPKVEKKSLVQTYAFDPSQECKITAEDGVMFTHDLDLKFTVSAMDASRGELSLKISQKSLSEKCGGAFPGSGSLLRDEFVSPAGIPIALWEVASGQLSAALHAPVSALLRREPPAATLQNGGESVLAAGRRITRSMSGGCLVIQGPPGTGKTYTAAAIIAGLLAAGKKVGITSNSHKAVMNLLVICGEVVWISGATLVGVKVGGNPAEALFSENPGLRYVEKSADARTAYATGVVGGTAWLFTRPEWEGALDFLFIDEAGQVPLANAVAMARCAQNLVLLGDQMQLEQPVQGSHPGDAGLSVLQYALKDTVSSKADAPVYHAVVPSNLGLFLGVSRRMHPDVCGFISESIYEGRLGSHVDCANQKIALPPDRAALITKESGIIFSGVSHDGNVQQSDEEVERIEAIRKDLIGRPYTARDGTTLPLRLADFLFIAPYNAQVRALQRALPEGARVGSVDKFQGLQAAVCILSLCSSYGEYGSRGLAFILDRNRINVAISRAQCLAIVVGDPRIAQTPPSSISEMRLLNLFCRMVEGQ